MAKNKTTELLENIRNLIVHARSTAANSIDFIQVYTNFQIGRAIVEHEQSGSARANYAARTISTLSKKLSVEFGRGFAERNLEYMR